MASIRTEHLFAPVICARSKPICVTMAEISTGPVKIQIILTLMRKWIMLQRENVRRQWWFAPSCPLSASNRRKACHVVILLEKRYSSTFQYVGVGERRPLHQRALFDEPKC